MSRLLQTHGQALATLRRSRVTHTGPSRAGTSTLDQEPRPILASVDRDMEATRSTSTMCGSSPMERSEKSSKSERSSIRSSVAVSSERSSKAFSKLSMGSGRRANRAKSKAEEARKTRVLDAEQNLDALRHVPSSFLRSALNSLESSVLADLVQSSDLLVRQVAAVEIQSRARGALARRASRRNSLINLSQTAVPKWDRRRVIVFGSLNMDLKAETSGSWPRPGSAHLGTFSMSPGGKGANEAVALSRLGVPTTLVGRVGKDEMGRALLEQLQSQQYRDLDCSHVRSSADASTGVAVLFVTEADGQKGSVVCQGANLAVGDAEVQLLLELLPPHPERSIATEVTISSRHATQTEQCNSCTEHTAELRRSSSGDAFLPTLLATPYMKPPEKPPILVLQLELPLQPMATVAAEARSRGCLVVLKASPLPAEFVDSVEALLAEGVDWCFLNEWEAPTLLGWGNMTPLKAVAEAELAAEAVLLRFPQLSCVVITCGVAHVLRERIVQARRLTDPGTVDEDTQSALDVVWRRSCGQTSNHSTTAPAPSESPRVSRGESELTETSDFTDSASLAERSDAGELSPAAGFEREEPCAIIGATTILVLPRVQRLFVDAIGAADAFLGGFLAAHARGLSTDQKLLWAGAAADISTMRPGGVNSMPSEDELQAVLSVISNQRAPAAIAENSVHKRGYMENELHLTVLSGSMQRIVQTFQEMSLSMIAAMLEEKDAFDVIPLQRAYDCYKLTKQSPLFRGMVRLFACIHLCLCAMGLLPPMPRIRAVQAIQRSSSTLSESSLVPQRQYSAPSSPGRSSPRTTSLTYVVPEKSDSTRSPRRSLVHDMPGTSTRRSSFSDRQQRGSLADNGPRSSSNDVHEARPTTFCRAASNATVSSPPEGIMNVGGAHLVNATEIISDGEWLFGVPLPDKPHEAAAVAVLSLLRSASDPKVDAWERQAQQTIALAMCLPCLQEDERSSHGDSSLTTAQATSRSGSSEADDSYSANEDVDTTTLCISLRDQGESEPLATMSEDGRWYQSSSRTRTRGRAAMTANFKQALLAVKFENGYDLLLASAEAGIAALIRGLLANGAAALGKNSEGENALHLAAKGQHRNAVLALLECSDLPVSGPNSVDSHGRSPLDVCALDFREEVEQMYHAAKSATLVMRRLPSISGSTLLYGRYHPFSKLGNNLRLAEDVRVHRPVAIKTGMREQVEKEASTMRLIGTEYAPEVYDVFPDASSGLHVLVMQAADAHSELNNVVSRQKKRAGLEVRHHAQRLLSCVRALHDLNLVHTDLKTKHFLRFDGEWRCIDFDSVTSEGTNLIPNCTVRYAAPEVARSRLDRSPVKVTKAVDVWAMALVLFHVFTGRSLWEDVEVDERMVADNPEKAVDQLETNTELTDPQRRLLKEMLVINPENRKALEEVLAKSFFKEGEDTEQAKYIEVLALFSSPKKLQNGKGIPPLQLMREITAMQSAIPRTMREIRPAARFPADVEPVLRQLTPRIIQFSGHGDAVKRGAYAGALAFELNGTIQLPNPQSFVDLLRKDICPRLELVFLNGCKTLYPLGKLMVEALPHLTVIGWDSVTADQAAAAFAQGFYDSVGRNCARGGGGGSKGDLMEAYVSAERAFLDGGFIKGNPATQPGTSGVYGILGQALTARRSSQVSRLDKDHLRQTMKRSFRAALAVTSMAHHHQLPLLSERSEGSFREESSFVGDSPPRPVTGGALRSLVLDSIL